MASFSQRNGYTPARDAIQVEGLDDESRMVLWNRLAQASEGLWKTWGIDAAEDAMRRVWADVLGRPRDEYRDSSRSTLPGLKSRILQGEWFEALDALEGFAQALDTEAPRSNIGTVIARALNDEFERLVVGYRFVGLQITPIDSEVALGAVEQALSSPGGAARHHLERALELMSNRQAPDYPNSIKESISAVESAIRVATGEAKFSDGVKGLEAKGIAVHPALKRAWLAMYGWASDEDGIRHGGRTPPEVNQALAKYVLVTSSAFVSYLLEVGTSNTSS